MKLRVALVLLLVCLSAIVFSCRRNPPSLIDANRAPDTELWYAPPDSTEYEYLVHLYWRGLDGDGVTPRFIWTITDTLVANPLLRWNPSERLADYRMGRITTKTDSVFSFEAFKNVAGVGLRKNRQTFHIAAIDDEGLLDPSPAAIEFVATVGELPEVHFTTKITRSDGNTTTVISKPYDPAVLDTVGMFRPFEIGFTGTTVNGLVRQYLYYPLTTTVFVPGQDVWFESETDTIVKSFSNTGQDAIGSGPFRFAAQCKDDAGAESRVDVRNFSEGVVQLSVNFEPDTRIFNAVNTYYIFFQAFTDTIDFTDGIPDTVPYNSWTRIDYRGWDSPFDSTLCTDDVNECIGYQVQYSRTSSRVPGATSKSRWLPDEPEDNNPFGVADSTSMNMGSVEYTIRARAVDEFGKGDGSPSEIEIIANYDPTLDTTQLMNWDGTVVGPAGSDTLVWDWTNPANSPDTVEFDLSTGQIFVVKQYYFDIQASGHDHPKEDRSYGVRNWYYLFNRTDDGELQKFGRSRAWVAGPSPNVLADRHEAGYRYNLVDDPGGQSIMNNPPKFWDSEYNYSIYGRDIPVGEEYEQFMFVNKDKRKLNSYQASALGRWTETAEFQFYFRMER
jgi:hypothetical protein